MVKIRLRRVGAKNKPMYRVVVANSRSPRDGAFIEIIGQYNPLPDPEVFSINEEKALKWLRNGAQPSETVSRLLFKSGIMEKFKPGSTQKQVLPKPKTKSVTKSPTEAKSTAVVEPTTETEPIAVTEPIIETEPTTETESTTVTEPIIETESTAETKSTAEETSL